MNQPKEHTVASGRRLVVYRGSLILIDKTVENEIRVYTSDDVIIGSREFIQSEIVRLKLVALP